MDARLTSPGLAPHTLTKSLVQANKFDENALEANRQGKLSAKQGWIVVEASGLALAMLVAILGLLGSCGIAFGSLNRSDWASAAIPIGIGVVMIAGLGVLFNLAKRTGTDKYLTNRSDALPRLFMMGIDMLRGKVTSIEGSVTRSHDVRESESRSDDGSTTRSRVDLYAYSVAGQGFYVEEAGYNAFPVWGQQCRLYYMPLSKALINIEVLEGATEQAPLDVKAPLPVLAPDSTTADVQRPNGQPQAAQTWHTAAPHNPVAGPASAVMGTAARINAVRSMNLDRMNPGGIVGELTSSPVYTQALQVACADQRVVAALGEPIKASDRVSGSVRRGTSGGVTELEIQLAGPRKKGTLYASARLEKDVWQFYTLQVEVHGAGEAILLGR